MHQNRTLDMAHFSCNFVAIFVILSKLDQYMKIEQLTSMPITTCKALCLYGYYRYTPVGIGMMNVNMLQ
jgi:hypothetical protein